jgi:hypothetical protein
MIFLIYFIFIVIYELYTCIEKWNLRTHGNARAFILVNFKRVIRPWLITWFSLNPAMLDLVQTKILLFDPPHKLEFPFWILSHYQTGKIEEKGPWFYKNSFSFLTFEYKCSSFTWSYFKLLPVCSDSNNYVPKNSVMTHELDFIPFIPDFLISFPSFASPQTCNRGVVSVPLLGVHLARTLWRLHPISHRSLL